MTISFNVPIELEEALRRSLGDVNAAAKEAAFVELYRQGLITHYELALALGLSRLQTEEILKQHQVFEDLPTTEEVCKDVEALRRLVPSS